ncbi:SAC3 family protein 1 [Elsinoe australis]|uniref:SAC3 family protein 1 n=1 Tax=Elsinoe australis TaxID=40998 RepID=A0A2P8A8D5_9PEZI|nr:SAC3 family protein 1 [Elsinoe australis]
MLAQNSDGARQPRPGFQTRGRGQTAFARDGATRGSPVRGATRGRGGAAARGGRPATPQPLGPTTGEPPQRFQLLKQRRENERKEAIRHGFLADPDKPRTLAEAITPVGTCPDMCAEFERLERIVQKDVWAQETREDGSADEARMVKKFRRAAAGIDEQLPSDLRPPQTLKKTCDYLFDTLIGGAESLGTVHHFVWDRTRAIRNDFSIQQITKPGDVEIAIECYERIARFHMLSLHQFAVPEKPYDKYDWYQEREQLDRTLLSLMQYYDDNRDRVNLKNEAEFRAYCIVFQIQDPIPDLEDRVSCFPRDIKNHPRVRIALDLYSAACNILDPQGPLKPREPHPVAREDWNGFFKTVESNQVSYLMACVSEIYFNMVRKQTLNAIWKSFKRQGSTAVITDFSLDYLTDLLRFDDFDQTRNFCEHYSFGFKDLPDQLDEYLDLNSVQGKSFPEATAGLSVQTFSQSVVENKRMGRTFSSVISGKNYATAKNEGQIVEEESMGYDGDMQMDDDGDSLFVPMDGPPKVNEAQTAPENPISGFSAFSTNGNTASNPFQAATAPTSTAFQSSTTGSNPFAKPPPSTNNAAGSSTPAGSPFAQKPGLQDSIFAKPSTASSPFSTWSKPSSSPWSKPVAPSDDPAQSNSKNASIFGQPSQGTSNTEQQPQQQTPKPTQSTMTSIHAPGNFSWSKPSPSPWSTSVSTAPTTSAAASTTPIATPTAPTMSSESVFSKPASQPNFPSFSFAKPAAPEQTQKELPKFNFANQSGDHQNQAETDKPRPSFSFPSAPSPTTNSQHAAQERNSTTTTSVFKFAPSSDDKTESSKPAFSFPSSQTASSKKKQESQPQKPLFSFTSQPAPPPSGTPTNASGLSQETAKDSVFSTQKTTSAEASKPFSFTSASPPQQQKQQPAQSAPPSQPAQAQQQPQPSLQRSPSFSQPNQPKKRSPLSQSFTAEEEQPKSSPSTAFNFDTPPRQPPVASSTPQSTFKAPVAPSQPPNQPYPTAPRKSVDPQAILTKLATEIVTDQERGLLRQFIEYHARPIIMSVYEELYAEEMRELADKFRKEKLAKRYGRRWRETSWRLRLARQGKEKREKRRTARRDRATAEENKRRRVETNAVDDFLKRKSVRVHQASVNGGSPAASFATTSRRSSVTSQSTVQTEPATNNNYRDSPREKVRDTAPANRVDSHGKIVKPSTPASSIDSSARKSHFLGFSVPKQRSIMGGSTPRQQSAYFRMKALGINPSAGGVATPMGPPPLNLKKRAREDDESELAEATPPPKKSRTPPQQTTSQSRMRSSSNFSQSSVLDLSPGRSTVGSVAMSRMDLEDNDILARARAARQAFRDSTRSHRSEARQQDNMSVVSQEEPSVKTKMQARLRAVNRAEQNLAQSVSTREVPAYRMRESRFVPREQYGRAVEQAKENLERRSKAGSIASARKDGLRPEAVEAISKPASVMSVNDDAPTPVASNAASMGHHSLRPEHARELSRPASAMSVHDDAPTPLATQPVSMDVEMSQTQTKSRSPSIRPASRGTQQDDSFSYQQSQSQQSQSFGFDHDSQPHSAQQHQPFGFDHRHQPRDAGLAPEHGWSFQALDSGATMPPQDTQLGQTPDDAFVAAAEPSQQPLASNFGDMDTQTISASSYLSLGNDMQTNGPKQFSTYPDIHENQVPRGVDVHQEDVPFMQDTEMVEDHQFLNDAAQQALGLDSSLNPFQQQHESQEDQQPGFLHQEMEEDSVYHQEDPSIRQEREESQIDPSLLDTTPDVPIAEVTEVREEVIPAPQLDKKPEMAQVRSASSLVSKNPFAALASASSEQGDSSSVSDSSVLDEDDDGEDGDEGEAAEREDHDSSILRQIDDDTFIPNGIIQDVLSRDGQTASDLQDAQRDVDPGTSFSSVTAPADLDAAPTAPSPIPRPASEREASALAEDPAPITQSKRQKPTPPALEVYQPPRTRSKSRDLSAPPTPTVTTRAAAREGSQRPPSRNGFLSPSPGDAALSSSPARRKSGSAQVEEHLPAVKEVEEEVVEGEGEGEEETKEGDEDGDDEVDDERADGNAPSVEEDERDQSGQELARRALEGVEDEDEEMGEVEVEEEDEEGEGMGGVTQAEDGDDEELEVEEDEEEEPGDGDEEPVDARNGNANGEDQEGYDEEGEEYDEDEEEYEEEEEEYDEEEDEGEDFPYQRSASRALTPGQMQESGLIKGGTGLKDDAFELSD